MRVYKLLLVDDEDDVRGRIASQIKDLEGFEIVGSAGNGYDALELIETLQPDIVLTDIRMPFIDGIELARILKREHPTIKVAFITGHDEFEYAKKALELQVSGYLMKPITTEEIKTFLLELKQKLDDEYETRQGEKTIRRQYQALLPVLVDSYLSSLIHAPSLTNDHLETLKSYGVMYDKATKYQSCLIILPKSAESKSSLLVMINELVKELFAHALFKHSIILPEGVFFIYGIDTLDHNEIDSKLFELVETMRLARSVKIHIGVSEIFSSFQFFPTSFKQSKRAVARANLYGYSSIVYHQEMSDIKTTTSFLYTSDFLTLDQLIQFSDEQSLMQYIKQLEERLKGKEIDIEVIHFQVGNLLLMLAQQSQVPIEMLCKNGLTQCVSTIKSPHDVGQLLTQLLLEIKGRDKRKTISHNERLINRAITYLQNNYQNPNLTLEELSSHLNISISHLSALMKKHTGRTFSSYLIALRMEKAKELLTQTQLKIADIAELCGYNDVYYFSHSFKKYTGISPRRYAKQ